MERVIVTKSFCGICHMQVCAVADATDEEILEVCNVQNPSGTSGGWQEVIRTVTEDNRLERLLPVTCKDHQDRKHFLIVC